MDHIAVGRRVDVNRRTLNAACERSVEEVRDSCTGRGSWALR